MMPLHLRLPALCLRPLRPQQFLSKLVVFPRKGSKAKKGDSSAAETAAATQFVGPILPIARASAAPEFVEKPEEPSHAYRTLRQERCNARIVGLRAKKAKEAAEKAPAKEKEGDQPAE